MKSYHWVAAAFVALATVAGYLTHRYNYTRGLERQLEASQLALKQQIVENESTRRELQQSVQDLLAQNTELRSTYNEAMAAAPGSKPVSASRLDTGPLTVHTLQSRPPDAAPTQPPAGTPAPQPGASCAVSSDQHISVEVDQIELSTKAGNTLIAGTAAVYVLEPVKALLVEGRFRSYMSDSHVLAAPSMPRWGAQGMLAWTPQGRVAGGGVLLPPLPLPFTNARLEPSAFVLGGATFVGGFGIGVRF